MTTKKLCFTFHYVSIKTCFRSATMKVLQTFTFHYVSIKTARDISIFLQRITLHSTMSLLKRRSRFLRIPDPISTLHSTMSLLKPICIY